MTSQVVLQAIISGILMGLIYALIAAGLSLIFGLMEIVNFAHGDHLMISMFSAFWFWMLFGIDPIYSIPLTILVMATLGVGDFEQDVFFTDDGAGDFADLDGALFGGEVYDGCVIHVRGRWGMKDG